MRRRAGDEDGAIRVLEIAHLVDDDPLRGDLREAIAARDTDMLLSIAESVDDEQPPTTLHLLAMALDRLNQREASLRVFETALLHHPESFLLQTSAANILERGSVEELERAVECYSAAAALGPDAVEVRHRLGYVLNELDRYEQAARALESALVRKPADGLLLYRLAWSLLHAGEYDEALRNFERSLETAQGQWWEAVLNQYYGRALREIGEPVTCPPNPDPPTKLGSRIQEDRHGKEATHRRADHPQAA